MLVRLEWLPLIPKSVHEGDRITSLCSNWNSLEKVLVSSNISFTPQEWLKFVCKNVLNCIACWFPAFIIIIIIITGIVKVVVVVVVSILSVKFELREWRIMTWLVKSCPAL